MTQSRSVLVLLVALVLSVSFAVPAEDVPETAYDESESLPFESTPEVSIAMPEAVAEAPVVRPRDYRLRPAFLRRPGAQQVDREAGRVYPVCDSLSILDHPRRC
jgi:hypothetical protein